MTDPMQTSGFHGVCLTGCSGAVKVQGVLELMLLKIRHHKHLLNRAPLAGHQLVSALDPG